MQIFVQQSNVETLRRILGDLYLYRSDKLTKETLDWIKTASIEPLFPAQENRYTTDYKTHETPQNVCRNCQRVQCTQRYYYSIQPCNQFMVLNPE